MFRRRRDAVDPAESPAEAEPADAEPAEAQPVAAAAGGPYDVADAPADDLGRLDLGGLLIPVYPDVEIRVEFDQQAGQVVAATLINGQSALQVNAFAAPRREGIWAEVREEIATSLRSTGGAAEEATGAFGRELRAQIPGEGGALMPARFVGVDGPRWFLRGLISGAAAVDAGQGARLEEAFRNIVVVRGADAMAPRDQLPLRLPREAMEAAQQAAAQQQAAQQQGQQGFNPFERGPEITEVR